MPIDPSIPLQAQAGSPFASMNNALQPLSSLAQLQNVRQQNQMMQAETQNLQQSAQLNTQLQGERNTFSSAMQDPNAPFKNGDGTIDYGKLQQWTATNTPLIGSQYGSQIMQMADHVNQYKTTLSSMADSDMQRTNAVLHSFMGPNGQPIADPQTMVGQLQALKRTLSGPGAQYVDLATQGIQTTGSNPQALQTVLGQLARDTTPASTQTTQLQGATGMVNNGAQTVPYSANGEYGQAPGTVTGTPGIPNQLSPEASAQRVPVFQNGQPGTVPLGSMPGTPGGTNTPFGSGRYGSQPGSNPNFVPSGASMGTPETYSQMSDHWTKLGNDAGNAQKSIGIANNIKAYANSGALSGAASDLDRLNGILAAAGWGHADDVKTATDLLNKNSAMLINSSGGGSDAQRSLISAATPNGHMNQTAINEAADQIISNQKMTLAEQKYLQPYKDSNNAQGYQSAITQFNNVSDPRIWQFADMNPAQRSAFKASMSPAQQKEFSAKIRGAEQLGVLQ